MDANTLLDILNPDSKSPSTVKLGTIPAGYVSGRPTVQFDGESIASVRTFPCVSGYTPAVGDRVIVLLQGHSGICIGRIAASIDPGSGATGPQGPTGPQGIQGETGLTGAQGIQGVKGDTGAQGIQGLKGDTGTAGTNGTNGIDGAAWFNGSGVPSSGTGTNGDYYLDTSNGDVYQKTSGAWGIIGNIKGATGSTGPTGATGTAGTNGTNGTNGMNGADSTANRIINGNFSINQRVLSGTVTLAAGAYGHDRWKAGASGCTYTFSTTANVTTITITAGSFIQVVEGLSLLSGTHCLSWTGTAQGKIGAGSYGATGMTGSATGGTNLNIEFNTGTVSKVQFVAGSATLTYQLIDFPIEMIRCLRYRWQSWADGVVSPTVGSISGYALTTNALMVNAKFPVPMRILSTIGIQNNNVSNQVRNSSTNAAVAATLSSISGQSNKGFSIVSFTGTPFTVGQYYDFDITADAEL